MLHIPLHHIDLLYMVILCLEIVPETKTVLQEGGKAILVALLRGKVTERDCKQSNSSLCVCD